MLTILILTNIYGLFQSINTNDNKVGDRNSTQETNDDDDKDVDDDCVNGGVHVHVQCTCADETDPGKLKTRNGYR